MTNDSDAQDKLLEQTYRHGVLQGTTEVYATLVRYGLDGAAKIARREFPSTVIRIMEAYRHAVAVQRERNRAE